MSRARSTKNIRLQAFNPAPEPNALKQGEWIVLVHGLFATRRSMLKIESRLSERGYHVVNWGYRTLLRSTEQHVQRLLRTVRLLQEDPCVASINFVTHSMGGILARCAVHFGSADKVRRIVMLAPPNTGSKLTRLSLGPFSWCCPAIADLSESPDSLPNRLTNHQGVEIGIIAALRDFVVPVENTVHPHQRDHCVIPTTHFHLPNNEEAVSQVLHFLSNGAFCPPLSPHLECVGSSSVKLRAAG